MELKITEINGKECTTAIQLVRKFRMLKNLPRCWAKVGECKTAHKPYESGLATIYQSKDTKKYYMVRYFDGGFGEMYAEIIWNF